MGCSGSREALGTGPGFRSGPRVEWVSLGLGAAGCGLRAQGQYAEGQQPASDPVASCARSCHLGTGLSTSPICSPLSTVARRCPGVVGGEATEGQILRPGVCGRRAGGGRCVATPRSATGRGHPGIQRCPGQPAARPGAPSVRCTCRAGARPHWLPGPRPGPAGHTLSSRDVHGRERRPCPGGQPGKLQSSSSCEGAVSFLRGGARAGGGHCALAFTSSLCTVL